jgi:hypothetical protein
MSALTATYYPHDDAGTRTFYFEKNTRDEPLITESYEEGFGFEAEVELNQGSLCYFDGLTNLEGRHGTKRLPFDGSGSAHPKGTSRLVLVIRGRANRNYRESFNKIYFVGRGVSRKAADSGNGGWVPGWKSNPLDKVDHEQAEKQKEERRKEKRERAKEEEAKRAAFEARMAPDRELHEAGKVAEDALVATGLIEELGQSCSLSEIFTCKVCNGKYTDGSGSGSGSKKNYGFCSKTCRDANRNGPRPKCEHGRLPSQCRDCGTGRCEHGRPKARCKDFGTGHCEHGRRERGCRDCSTGAGTAV